MTLAYFLERQSREAVGTEDGAQGGEGSGPSALLQAPPA